MQIAAGLKELSLESAFTHLAKLGPGASTSAPGGERRKIPVERSGGGT
jgi:hypothetical protein